MTHMFKLGQHVTLNQGFRTGAASGDYEIIKLVSGDAGGPRYKIKSLLEPHERMVPEDELAVSPSEPSIFG